VISATVRENAGELLLLDRDRSFCFDGLRKPGFPLKAVALLSNRHETLCQRGWRVLVTAGAAE